MKLDNKIKFVSKLLENLDEKKSLKELNETQKNLRRLCYVRVIVKKWRF